MNDQLLPLKRAYCEIKDANVRLSDFLDEREEYPIEVRLLDYFDGTVHLFQAMNHIRSIPNYMDDVWLRDAILGLQLFLRYLPPAPVAEWTDFKKFSEPENFASFRAEVLYVVESHYSRHAETVSRILFLWQEQCPDNEIPVVSRQWLIDCAGNVRDDLSEGERIRGHIDRALKQGVLIKRAHDQYWDMGWEEYIKSRWKRRSPDGID